MEAILKAEKNGGGGTTSSKHSRKKSFTRPSWLLCTIAGNYMLQLIFVQTPFLCLKNPLNMYV